MRYCWLFFIFIIFLNLNGFALEFSLLGNKETYFVRASPDNKIYERANVRLETDETKYKSPGVTFLISLLAPGLIIHGSGHMYVGKMGTGLIIFGAEILSIGLAVYEFNKSWNGCPLDLWGNAESDTCRRYESF